MKKLLSILALSLISMSCFGQNGWESLFELHGGPGKQELSHYAVSISFSEGYKFLKGTLFIGAATGVTIAECRKMYYVMQTSEFDARCCKFLVPIFGKVIYAPLRGKYSPMIGFDYGYSFDLFNEKIYRNLKGVFYEPQIGIDIKTNKTGSIYFSLGLNVQDFEYNTDTQKLYESTRVKTHEFMKNINFHLGCRF